MKYILKTEGIELHVNTDSINLDVIEASPKIVKVVMDMAPLSARGYWVIAEKDGITYLGPYEDIENGLATSGSIFEEIEFEGYKVLSWEESTAQILREEKFWEAPYYAKMVEMGLLIPQDQSLLLAG